MDATGTTHRNVVSSRTSYPKSGLPEDLLHGRRPTRLALVTCGGAVDVSTGLYAENVVVLAEPP